MSAANQLDIKLLVDIKYPHIVLQVPSNKSGIVIPENQKMAAARAAIQKGFIVVGACPEPEGQEVLGKRVLLEDPNSKLVELPYTLESEKHEIIHKDEFILTQFGGIWGIFQD